MLKFNRKALDITTSEQALILYLKNGSRKEFLVSEIVKIHLEITKISKLKYVILLVAPASLMFLSTDKYILLLIVLIYTSMFFLTQNNLFYHKFKFKLIIQNLNKEIYQFGFENHLKYKAIDAISLIRNNKSIL